MLEDSCRKFCTVSRIASEQVSLDRGGRWRDWLTGREVEAGRGAAQALPLAQLFTGPHALPFALMVTAEGGPAA
jgi:hypothetical protein